MADNNGKFAIFDYFESETVDVGLVSDIQFDSELKDTERIVRVRWSVKGVKKGGKSKTQVYSAKILNFHGLECAIYINLTFLF
jgi:hypothetical protein